MMKKAKLKLLLIFIIILLNFFPIIVEAENIPDIEVEKASEKVQNVFILVFEANEAGGDVEDLVMDLNVALDLLNQAKVSDVSQARSFIAQAMEILERVEGLAPIVRDEGIKLRQSERVMWILLLLVLVIGGVVSYFYGPRLFWSLWLKMRKDYIVRIVEEEEPVENGSLLVSGEVWAVIISVILLVTVFSASEIYYSTKVIEPFSELGILGPNMMIDDYPTNVTIGERIDLNIYVANNLGRLTYYVVMVKQRDGDSSLDPAPGSADATFDLILLHKDEKIFAFNMTIEKPGLNQRLIFELWTYDAESDQLKYHDRFGWIWINVKSA